MILKIAHRGASGYEPENTLLSFERAVELNADMIELDVQVCATGEIIVMHDLKVDRTTDGHGYVRSLGIEEIRKLQIVKNQRVPTLSEALDFIDGRVGVNVEIKQSGISEKVNEILNKFISSKKYMEDDFLVSSFDQYELINFKRINNQIETGVLLAGIPLDFPEHLKRLDVQTVNMNIEFLSEELVNIAHLAGKRVYVWTVNDPDDIENVVKMGVDAIISNYPDRLVQHTSV